MLYTTLGALRRADQLYYEQISERRTLECGLACYAREFPASIGDNAFREVLLPPGQDVDTAWREVDAFYSAQGLICRRWVPCAGQDPAELEPFLTERGFVRRTLTALALESWPEGARRGAIRVLPARAMRRAFRDLHVEGEDVALAERRLDYAHFDVFVALLDGRPAGRCGLFQAGEVAEIRDLYVASDFRRLGVGTGLLAEALGLARRLMMKIVVTRLADSAAEAQAFLGARGFWSDGQLVEFDRQE